MKIPLIVWIALPVGFALGALTTLGSIWAHEPPDDIIHGPPAPTPTIPMPVVAGSWGDTIYDDLMPYDGTYVFTLEESPGILLFNGKPFPTPAPDPNPPAVDVFRPGGETVFSIDQDGKVTLGDGVTPDEAAKLFWKAVEDNFPCGCSE